MTSANLDLVRSICRAWERGDYSSADWAHPEIEYVVADGPSPGSWIGLRGMAEALRDQLSAWEEARIAAPAYRELDDDRVLVLSHYTGRGKTSGMDLGGNWTRTALLFHVGEGKVMRLVQYFDRDRALADLGLSPEDDAADVETGESLD